MSISAHVGICRTEGRYIEKRLKGGRYESIVIFNDPFIPRQKVRVHRERAILVSARSARVRQRMF